MPLLTPLTVPRKPIAADNPVTFDSNRASAGFYTPSSPFLGWQVIPHDNKWSDGSPSFMAPISHYHLLQSESFHVQSGSGYWIMGRGRNSTRIRLTTGDDITIPRCVAHRFESIPNDAQQPLVIQYRYDAQRWEMEERFFRNILPYMDDCRRASVQPSLCQLCVFLADCWMPPELLWCPGGEYVRCALNALVMWLLAAVGVVLYGYRRSYVEYYDPEVSRRRMEREMKKGQ